MSAQQALRIGYRRTLLRRWACLGVLAALLLASFITDLATGPAGLSWWDVARGLLQPQHLDAAQAVIILEIRVPYALMALVVGASLGLAGAEMQTALNNPLASPFTLGVGAAATLGAALVILLRPNLGGLGADLLLPLAAFVCAFISCLLLLMVARVLGEALHTLVLFGIALVFSCNALVALLQLLATEDVLQQLVFWSLGSVARANWDKLGILAVVLFLTAPFSFQASAKMTLLRMGEDRARSFGVDVRRLRYGSLLRISLLAATAVAFVGTIGFVGLVGPHMARLLVGEDQRFLLPASALAGKPSQGFMPKRNCKMVEA